MTVKKILMNMVKQRSNLKKCMITLLKVWKFAANVWHQSDFEKRNALHGTIKTLLDDGKEITTRSEICVMLSTL